MKCYRYAAGIAALLATAISLLLPPAAQATVGSSIQAYQYCIVRENAQALGKSFPNFGNLSSCTTVALAAQEGTAAISFSPPEVKQLPPGSHLLYVRFQDDLGAWGPARAQRFTVTGAKTITAGKYFIDSDGDPSAPAGAGGYPADLPVAGLLVKEGWKLATDNLSPGKHTLLIYLQDSTGTWGPARRYTFYTAAKPTISAGRFFVTPPDTLPADYLAALAPTATANLVSLGRPLNGTLGTASTTLSGTFTPPPALDYGLHIVYGLFMDSGQSWTKGWLDPAGTPEVSRTALYVGNRLSVSATDSDGSILGRDGSVQVSAATWSGVSYLTPAMSCTSASLNCTDVYPVDATVTLTAVPKPWVNKIPVWKGCFDQGDGRCLVTMEAAKAVSLQFVDSVAPNTVINSVPLKLVNVKTASFAFSLVGAPVEDNYGYSFRCLLDGDPANDASFAPCTSPKSLTGVAEGQHTFHVKAVDKAGNKDVSPASYSWTVDLTPPTVTALTMPATSNSLTVTVGAFSATDNLGVTGYLLSESSTPPAALATGWKASRPVDYTFQTAGNKTVYAWAKDEAGNVSLLKSFIVNVDLTPPTVTSFSLPQYYNSLTVPLTMVAVDAVGVTGYFVAESTVPAPTVDSAWIFPKPANHTFGAAGGNTLYLWARDLAGNISSYKSAVVTVDLVAPQVDSFSIVPLSASKTVSITGFTASDNIAVSGYFLGESTAPPALSDSKWSTTAQTVYQFGSAGDKTLYAWVRDAAGNVSPAAIAFVTVDLTAPVVSGFTLQSVPGHPAVTVTGLLASDNVAVDGYFLSESSASPGSSAPGWSKQAPVGYTFGTAGPHVLYAFARDTAGNVSVPTSALVSTTWELTTTRAGTGSGTVNADHVGTACFVSASGCSAYPGGVVTLYATPSIDSTFAGWSGACSGSAGCQVSMDASKTVGATFVLAPQAKIGQAGYASLQSAYDAAANGATIKVREGNCSGGLIGNRAVNVTIVGGYQADYSAVTDETTLAEKIAIGKGRVSVKTLKVK